jgi:hypothetical protein
MAIRTGNKNAKQSVIDKVHHVEQTFFGRRNNNLTFKAFAQLLFCQQHDL